MFYFLWRAYIRFNNLGICFPAIKTYIVYFVWQKLNYYQFKCEQIYFFTLNLCF